MAAILPFYGSEYTIVRNGLVLNLDARYLSSYPGSGTTWTDLSGNGNNGTLTNGPTFSSTEGGSIVFDGVNDYVLVSSNANIPVGSSARTVNVWFYTNSTSWAADSNTLFFYGQGSNLNSFGIDMDVYPKMQWFGFGAGADIIWNTTFSQVGWKNITVTYNGSTTILIYENGTLTQNYTTSTLNTTASSIYVGSFGTAFYYDGRISSVSMYNRALSAAEISQNFNALRGRFRI